MGSCRPDQFCIKRLVALGDEQVRIGDDRHLIINGNRLDAATPHFENVCNFDAARPTAGRPLSRQPLIQGI